MENKDRTVTGPFLVRTGNDEKAAREGPSLKGSVLASQLSHHFNALSCSDVSLCMVLPRPLFPLCSVFLASIPN